jgi:hypothetical protein
VNRNEPAGFHYPVDTVRLTEAVIVTLPYPVVARLAARVAVWVAIWVRMTGVE